MLRVTFLSACRGEAYLAAVQKESRARGSGSLLITLIWKHIIRREGLILHTMMEY